MLIKLYVGAGNGAPSTGLESILASLGGFTRYEGAGAWIDGGVVEREASLVYEVVVPGNSALPIEVREFVTGVKKERNQRRVLVVVTPTTSELLL